jgi:para-aminobenzoate synthetase/4-amino-4-deoxychorismate lyase
LPVVKNQPDQRQVLNASTTQVKWMIGAECWMREAHPTGALLNATTVLVANELAHVGDVLERAWQASLDGKFVFGWVAYDAAPAFDAALKVHGSAAESAVPLALFFVFDAPFDVSPEGYGQTSQAALKDDSFTFSQPWLNEMSEAAIFTRMGAVRSSIAEGRYYQLNLTTRLRANADGQAAVLFERMHRLQPQAYSFFLETEDWAVASVSPELFFEWKQGVLTTRPMKGTAVPSGCPQLDRQTLLDSEKDRAENVMIVDLLRNDLSRVAKPGAVQTQSLFDVHVHPTVVQMSSCIQARTREGTSLTDVFAALFPCGSVTGAPKSESMRHLSELEGSPRGLYCGAVGMLAPGGHALFNVAIRTAVFNRREKQLVYGVGSGITWYSDVAAEWAEWQVKSRLAHRSSEAFRLLQTVRLEGGQWRHGELHKQKMKLAATRFGFAFPAEEISRELSAISLQYASGIFRGRWLLDAQGNFEIEVHPWTDLPSPLNLMLAEKPFAGEEAFTQHKTTWRKHYDQHVSTLENAGDTLLFDGQGRLTETLRGNLVLQIADTRFTPHDNANFLSGVFRDKLLSEGALVARDLFLEDLVNAQACWVINSLRGWVPVASILNSDASVFARFDPQR